MIKTKADIDRLYSYDSFSICRIKIWKERNILLLIEQGGNRGKSVTDASQELATAICNEYKLDKSSVKVFETCAYKTPLCYDRVGYIIRHDKFADAQWSHFGNQKEFEDYIDA